MALVMVLWGVTLLTVMAASFAFSVRVETAAVGNYVHRAQARAIAEAGVRRAILELLAPPGSTGWRSRGEFHDIDFGEGRVRIAAAPESANIDLNRAPEELIHGLFDSLVENLPEFSKDDARNLSEAVLDWRGAGTRTRSAVTRRRKSAALRQFRQGSQGGFLSVAELNRVSGMQPEIFRAIEKSVTVYSQTAKIDPASAPRRVLLAIPGLNPDRVGQFVSAREALYRSDDDANKVQPKLPLELLEAGARHLSRSRISVFTVSSQGTVPGGVSVSVTAVVRLTGQAKKPYSILAWSDTPSNYSAGDNPK
jgi:general secretion pathway protein K